MADTAYLGTLAFAFGAGVATFFAPCAYPLLPGYVAYYVQSTDGASGPRFRGAVARGAAAAFGVLVVFSALSAAVYAFGRVVVEHVELVDPVVGAALVVVGAATLLDRMPELRFALPERRSSMLGFLVFGAAYAVAAAGCVLPVLSAVVLQSLRFAPLRAAVVLAVYALGVCGLLLAVTVLSAVGSGLDATARVVRLSERVVYVAGVVMVLAGAWQLYRSVVLFNLL